MKRLLIFSATFWLCIIALPIIAMEVNRPTLYGWEQKIILEAWENYIPDIKQKISKNEIFEFIKSNAFLFNKIDIENTKLIHKIVCSIAQREKISFDISQADLETLAINMAMNRTLQQANDFRFLSMELANLLHEDFSKTKQRLEEERQNQIIILKNRYYELEEERALLIDKKNSLAQALSELDTNYRRSLKTFEAEKRAIDADIAAQQKKINDSINTIIKQPKVRGLTARERLKAKIEIKNTNTINTAPYQINKCQIDIDEANRIKVFNTKKINLDFEYKIGCIKLQNELDGAIFQLDHVNIMLDLTQQNLEPLLANVENFFHARGEHLQLEGSMPVLSLFQPQIKEDRFLATLESIGHDLFLTIEYFSHLDGLFLAQQKLLAKQVIDTTTNGEFMDDFTNGITHAHIQSLQGLVTEIFNLHVLEEKKRLIAQDSNKISTYLSTADILTFVDDYARAPNNLPDEQDLSKEWLVSITKNVERMRDEIQNGELLEELVEYLTNHGPILRKGDDLNRRFRNFSPLSKNDFHCHLGSSNVVAVWKVDKDNQTIKIYYLGPHPSTYNRVL